MVEFIERTEGVRAMFRQLDGTTLLPDACICDGADSLECPIDTHRIRATQRLMQDEQEERMETLAPQTEVTTPAAEQIRQIAIELLQPSPTNPRKTFDADELQHLAASIQTSGLISPIVVRPIRAVAVELEDGSTIDSPPMSREKQSPLLMREDVVSADVDDSCYEIVAGERRYRACRMLGWTTIPCLVRELTDEQVLQLQVIENLQRQDLHPMEEALGFKQLLEIERTKRDRVVHVLTSEPHTAAEERSDVELIADQVHKSPSYIYTALKLTELIPDAARAFQENKISKSHAALIARLQPPQQENALYASFEQGEAVSVRRLAEYIARAVHRKLNGTPWRKDDVTLVPEAGACNTCPKNTGANKLLDSADGRSGSTCTDSACFDRKARAMAQRAIEKAPANVALVSRHQRPQTDQKGVIGLESYYVLDKKTKCAHAETAVVVEGEGTGANLLICRSKECPKHGRGNKASCDNAGDSSANRYREEERRKERARQLEMEARREAMRRLFSALHGPIKPNELKTIAVRFFESTYHDGQVLLGKTFGWDLKGSSYGDVQNTGVKKIEAMKPAELFRFLLCLSCAADLSVSTYTTSTKTRYLETFCREYKVDLAGIREELKGQAKTKQQKKSRAKAAAASAGKGGRK